MHVFVYSPRKLIGWVLPVWVFKYEFHGQSMLYSALYINKYSIGTCNQVKAIRQFIIVHRIRNQCNLVPWLEKQNLVIHSVRRGL